MSLENDRAHLRGSVSGLLRLRGIAAGIHLHQYDLSRAGDLSDAGGRIRRGTVLF